VRSAVALSCLALFGCAGEPKLPNVVLITIDTLRADRLPFHANVGTAPFLADLAERSVVFERCWAASSWTAPSTASLFAGVYPLQHGLQMGIKVTKEQARKNETLRLNQLPADLQTVPELMKSLGYSTYGVTDNINICEKMGFARGFDRFKNSIYRGAEHVNYELSRWNDEIRSAEPFFVYLHYMDPHAPYHSREPWFEANPSPDLHARNLPRYDSEISYVDQHIRLACEALGVGDDTVVIVVADHGEEFGDHGGSGHDFKLYSELTHVPLVIHQPGVDPVRHRVAANVSLVDVLPTLRSILGVAESDQDEGMDLTRHYRSDEAPEPRHIFSMRASETASATVEKHAVIFENHKYILSTPAGRQELFDLAADPGEKQNLARTMPELALAMRSQLTTFQRSARRWKPETVGLEFDEEQLEALEQLGYVGGK